VNDWRQPSTGTEQPAGTEEDATGQLLRAAGPRWSVEPDRAARVRLAVRAAWRTSTRRRTIGRRLALATALAGAAALVFFASGRVDLFDREVGSSGESIAVVEAIDGAGTGVQRGVGVRVGEWIVTGPGTRLRLRFGRDTSVRVDVDSRLRALAANVIELSSGAVYVDARQGHSALEIRTLFGTARDVGTQFEVRLLDDSLRLRVRTGMVELRDRARAISGRPGTEITLSPGGAVTRPIAPHSPEWAWVNRLSPPLEIEGVALATFLERVAHEQGWTVGYGDAALAQGAESVILHGSVSGLAPHEAVEVAIASSGLRHRLADGSLVVLRAGASDADQRGRLP
jgi:FecR-like protein